ncbi:MAG TPA: type II toxin-antitoxin system VapB family antitoxin [Gaiellaceae bacterium]|jgi:Arc/MetJ family transcription regulator|nr:type II toxin-antitoxin system VapB family antitoxin [Gaiellaceae bacterium]
MPREDAAEHIEGRIRRTSLNLDTALVAEARKVLGTAGTTDTVHGALADVVNRERRRSAAGLRFDDLDASALERLRAPRTSS